MPFGPRKESYEADVTYGTNSEFGFDYLRDNMSVSLEGLVQRGHPYAIVDEVDSILIDEARTPLIISGEPETAAQIYYDFARVAPQLVGAPRASRATRRARPRPPAPTTSTTRSTRPSPSPSRASRRSSARCGSTTSTRRRTRSSSTISCRR